jgi:hypothetical protein
MVAFFRSSELQTPNEHTARLYHGAVRIGTSLLILGIVTMVIAGVAHWITLRKLRQGHPLGLTVWPLSITLAMLSAVVGLAGLWAALAP